MVFYPRNLNSHCAERPPAGRPLLRFLASGAAMSPDRGNLQPSCPSPLYGLRKIVVRQSPPLTPLTYVRSRGIPLTYVRSRGISPQAVFVSISCSSCKHPRRGRIQNQRSNPSRWRFGMACRLSRQRTSPHHLDLRLYAQLWCRLFANSIPPVLRFGRVYVNS